MKKLLLALVLLSFITAIGYGQSNTNALPPKKIKLLVQLSIESDIMFTY